MPRRARVALGGVPWHIIQRGNNRSACFVEDADRERFLEILADQANRWECRLHAWVLMTNHFHLLLTPERADGPAGLMKHLGQRHVQYVNRRHARTGSLWEGRFRSSLAQDGAYVLTCYRYIELNPVRAGMVAHPRDYPWSSFHANGGGVPSDLLTPHADYLALGETSAVRTERYRALLETGLKPGQAEAIRASTNGNFILGDARFGQRVAAALGRRVERRSPGRPPGRGRRRISPALSAESSQ